MARCCCKPVLFLGSTLHILCAIGCATATITAIWAIHLYDPLSILTHQYFYIIPHVQHVTTYSRSKEKNNNDSNNDNGDLFTLNAFVGARKWILKWYIAIQFDHYKLDICTGVCSPYVNLYKWAGSKRSSNCPCRMIALRACLHIPYAVACLAYARDFSDMALREAYAGTFFTFFICPHRNCLREPFPLAPNHTRPSWTFELCFCSNHIIFRHLLLPTFRKLYFSFRGHRCHTNPFRELSRPIFWNKCACPLLTSIGQFWHQGLCGWHCGLGLRGPYAHLTRPLRGFHLHWLEISSWNLAHINGSFLILPLSDLTRETLRNILSNKKLTPAYADLSFPYAGRPYDKAPT